MVQWIGQVMRAADKGIEVALSSSAGPAVGSVSKISGFISALVAYVHSFVSGITISDATIALSFVGAAFFTLERYYTMRIRRKEWERLDEE